MTLNELGWRDEYLIYPAVKSAVAVLARLTAYLYVAAALFWGAGLALLCCARTGSEDAFIMVSGVSELAAALAVPCLYLLALWCHHVLLAGRGMTASRWLLFFLLFFAFLHSVCVGYELLTGGALLLVNQFLLPPVLYTVLTCAFVFNWLRMSALPLRYRLLLLCFFLTLLGQYILQGSFLTLLLPCFAWEPLRLLARYAPQIASLPPAASDEKPSHEKD